MEEPKPMLQWIITDRCNYACPYCSFPKLLVKYGHCSDKIISRVFDVIDSLEGEWLVGLIGGEPLIHPRIYDMCEKIRQCRHKITMVTNLSVSKERIKGFIDACGDSLRNIMISLHESQIKDVDAYIENIAFFRDNKKPKTFFGVTSVVTEDNFNRLKEIDKRLKKAGLKLSFQVLKQGGRYVQYPQEIEDYISGRALSNLEKIRKSNFRGCLCYSGKYYFIISIKGHVCRCNNMQPYYYLGDVSKGTFKPLDKAIPCLSKRCTCTTASNLNMIRYDESVGKLKTFLYWYPRGLVQNVPLRIHHTKKFFQKRAMKIKNYLQK